MKDIISKIFNIKDFHILSGIYDAYIDKSMIDTEHIPTPDDIELDHDINVPYPYNCDSYKRVIKSQSYDRENIRNMSCYLNDLVKKTMSITFYTLYPKYILQYNDYTYDMGSFIFKYIKTYDTFWVEKNIGYLVNILQDKTPNFIRTYTDFSCERNSLDLKHGIKREPHNYLLCMHTPKSKRTRGLLIEKIYGKTWSRMCFTLEIDDFWKIIFQVLLSLEVAQEIKFTHYDLHTLNILVEEYVHPIKLRYIINEKEIFIHSRFVAKIIDYGRSFVEYKERPIGKFVDDTVIVPVNNPVMDVYKFLYTTQYILSDISIDIVGRTQVDKKIKQLDYILQMFYNEKIEDKIILGKNIRSFFLPPYVEKYTTIPPIQFLSNILYYLPQYVDIFTQSDSSSIPYNCDIMKCTPIEHEYDCHDLDLDLQMGEKIGEDKINKVWLQLENIEKNMEINKLNLESIDNIEELTSIENKAMFDMYTAYYISLVMEKKYKFTHEFVPKFMSKARYIISSYKSIMRIIDMKKMHLDL